MSTKKKTQNEVYVTYDESREGGGKVPDDDWMYEDEYRDWLLTGVYKTKEKADWIKEVVQVDFEPEAGQEVYVLVVRYNTGSTFGQIYGCGTVEGVYKTYKEAQKVQQAIEGDKYDKCKYPAWKGYFESLQSVEIEVQTLRE